MGLYDEVICKYPLPKGYEQYQNDIFQTKSFERLLNCYLITEDGRLEMGYEDNGKPYLYNGDIVFYTSEKDDFSLRRFGANFHQGQIQWIKPIKEQIMDNVNIELTVGAVTQLIDVLGDELSSMNLPLYKDSFGGILCFLSNHGYREWCLVSSIMEKSQKYCPFCGAEFKIYHGEEPLEARIQYDTNEEGGFPKQT